MESLGSLSALSGSFSIGERTSSRIHKNVKIKQNITCSSTSSGKTSNIGNIYPCLQHGVDNNLNGLGQRPIALRCGKRETRFAGAALQPPLESEPEASNLDNKWNFIKDRFITFCDFMRIYAFTGMVTMVISVSLIPVERLSDLNLAFFTGLLQALIPLVLMHMFVVGLNHLADVEIDKINKPHLPLASGNLSLRTILAIVSITLIMSFCFGIAVGSTPLLWAVFFTFVHGTGYSINLPLLRWKGSAITAALSIVVFQAIALPISYFLHMQTHVLGKPAHLPRPMLYAVVFMSLINIVIALSKDIPDIDGDQKHGVKSLAIKLGKKKVFGLCVSILLINYLGAIFVGSLASNQLNKVIAILGHLVLAFTVLGKAQSVDLNSKTSLQSFYLFIWKLHNIEYLLIQFMK